MSAPVQPQVAFRHRLGQDPLPVAAGSQMVYTLLEIAVMGETAEIFQLPLNLCLVLDHSLSMRGEKMDRVKEAARYVLSQLGRDDSLAVVAFNDRATVMAPAQLVTQPQDLAHAIENIVPRGGTELASGLDAGLAQLQRGRSLTGPAISSLLVLTDGRTYGDESRCMELAEVAQRRDMLITPLGVGDEWNEDLLETLAYRCGSHSEYIDQPAAIVTAFRQHIADLRHIYGRQAALTVRTAAQARLVQVHRVAPLIGRVEMAPGANAGEQRLLLGNLMLGEVQGLLLEIVVPPVAGETVHVAACTLEWQPTDHKAGIVRLGYPIRAAVDVQARPALVLDPAVKGAVEKVVAYKLQKRAWQDLQDGNLQQATTKLRMVATRLLDAGEIDLAQTVQAEAEHLEQHGFASAVGTKQIKYGTRGLGRTQHMRMPEPAPG
jgi:Ca-activated chloride channel homolog